MFVLQQIGPGKTERGFVLARPLHHQLAAPAPRGFPVKPSEPAALERQPRAVPRAAPRSSPKPQKLTAALPARPEPGGVRLCPRSPLLTFHRGAFVGVGVAFPFPLDPPDYPPVLKQVLAFEIEQLDLKN